MEFEDSDEMMAYCQGTGRTYVAMSLAQAGSDELGTLVLELYTDIAPATCANFVGLVKGGQYSYEGLGSK
ncbi:hypothetical protein TSOC_013079, partial [Tetrabaena socialis]